MAAHGQLVTPTLMVGGVEGARDAAFLKANNITHIVNLGPDPAGFPTEFKYWEAEVAIHDKPEEKDKMLAALPAITQFIAEGVAAGGTAYVHCGRGVSKASTAAIAFLLSSKTDTTLKAAYERCAAARSVIRPNDGFMEALGAWEVKVTGAAKPSMTAADRA